MPEKHNVRLSGISFGPTNPSVPAYLSAVGVHRLVVKADPEARGYWDNDVYVLQSQFDEEGLVQYLLTETPVPVILSPWLGGETDVWISYRQGLLSAYKSAQDLGQEWRFKDIMQAFRLTAKNIPRSPIQRGSKEAKRDAAKWCRSHLSDAALDWIDTVAPGAQFTDLPLTGYGGLVGGKSSIASKWASSLLRDVQFNASRNNREFIRGYLFGNCTEKKITNTGMGSIKPINAAWKKDTVAAATNPWETILSIEGMMMFSASVVRRNGSHGMRGRVLGAPWSFGPDKETEIWMPIWSEPAKMSTLQHLFAEGRSQVGRNAANSPLGFALATNTGVDKGIDRFLRFKHYEGNGQTTFLTYQGTYRANSEPDPKKRVLEEILSWYNRVPTKVGSTHFSFYVQLHHAIELFTKDVRPLRDVFLELGEVMYKLSSTRNREDILPVSLSPRWLTLVQEEDDSPELRLATALASSYTFTPGKAGSRRNFQEYVLHTMRQGYRTVWNENDTAHTVWLPNDAEASLAKLLHRWCIEVNSTRELRYHISAQLPDIDKFLNSADFSMCKFNQYIKSCALVQFKDWEEPSQEQIDQWREERKSVHLSPLYYALKLCFSGHRMGDITVPYTTQPLRLALQGNAERSYEGALRRLQGSGLRIQGNARERTAEDAMLLPSAALTRRIALAVALPIGPSLQGALAYRIQK